MNDKNYWTRIKMFEGNIDKDNQDIETLVEMFNSDSDNFPYPLLRVRVERLGRPEGLQELLIFAKLYDPDAENRDNNEVRFGCFESGTGYIRGVCFIDHDWAKEYFTGFNKKMLSGKDDPINEDNERLEPSEELRSGNGDQVYVPTSQPTALARWKETWRLIHGWVAQGIGKKKIVELLKSRKHLRCGTRTLGRIIKAGEAGLLD
jgi:hypothetical protein